MQDFICWLSIAVLTVFAECSTQVIDTIDIVFSIAFGIEVALRIIASRVMCGHWKAFFQSSWNWLDLIVTVVRSNDPLMMTAS